ncbi:3-hydroxyacyl-CoA dehydrogenase NAD-binding domain-containing protein [Halomonas urumqiensis]|uniref:3-hydroxyacyl-CoA dehydrogenase n=1 Tax=Halomonas urumqiensis TaxID=1684789 RepID=A0A2N7UMK0_9GAMM|nr:3-hydroxyacyl-CoA dehydrogenase NAD-binding domain-containing protein [Halomonas urumqiensis]PMR81632.1 3-hydroxyacyl-CoA dehydrogenase [Halomonas urumqiensis]PTB02269.1 3-hydroxyacyl-CoA dehydrogenase [Halomonas urumqiensis]GHE21737.1 3-hydroxyacyl-CoA dehydrogenase [Halomonas urumqiensis]
MSVFAYQKDADGIVTITMDQTGPVNAMNQEYRDAMRETLERLEGEEGLAGVVFASAKKVFFAGGDLNELLAVQPGEEATFMALSEAIKSDFRRLERLPVPVVAAINGAALGGGFELCLACNRRIAWDDTSVQIGLPEVGLGLLPGAGGIVRLVNLLGLEAALPYLLEGKRVAPAKALADGLVDELVESREVLLERARSWILEQRGNDTAAQQPWDRKGFKLPGGKAGTPALAQLVTMAAPMLQKKTRGLLPAPEMILDCALEAARLDVDTALRIESRGLTRLVTTPEAKNMISTFFFQMNKVKGGASRPAGVAKRNVERVGVLGAGMMGQGIAYVSAAAGIEVVLKDISVDAAERGKAYSARLLDKQIERGRASEAKKADLLSRITTTADDADLAGCDLIIEAVFEDIELKNRLLAATEPHLAEDVVWGSNTSSLPITQLAEASRKPENFIGIHFFSPVDKMPLVEIICGEQTSDETLAKAFDYTLQIRKTPIVVNDSLGFFTSRTFGTYLDEGVRLLHEGVDPVLIDSLGKAVGMPVGPLAVHDEVSLELTRKAQATWKAMGVQDKHGEQRVMREVIDTMVGVFDRGGRYHGGGFYEYREDGGKTIWPNLYEMYHQPTLTLAADDIKDRLVYRQVVETLKCLQEGVLGSVADGNVGSILGIGAPVHTGGFIQFVNTCSHAGKKGPAAFVARCEELAKRYGERFAAPAIVREKAAAGESLR